MSETKSHDNENETRNRWMLGVLVLLVAVVPALARPHGPGPGPGIGFGFLGGPMFERIAERLELTSEQQEQIEALLEEYRPGFEEHRDLMQSARETLHDQIHADTFDEGAIRQAASEVAALEADFAVTQALIGQDLRQILTPEQLAEATEMAADARAFRREAGERFRGHRGPRSETGTGSTN